MRTSTGANLGMLIVAGVSAAFIAIGSLGTWVTFGPLSASGLEGGRDGWITLLVAGAAAITIWRYFTRPRRTQAGWLIIQGISAIAVGAYDAQDITSKQVEVLGSTVGPQVGWGLWIVLIAGGVLGLTGIALLRDKPAIVGQNDESPPARAAEGQKSSEAVGSGAGASAARPGAADPGASHEEPG